MHRRPRLLAACAEPPRDPRRDPHRRAGLFPTPTSAGIAFFSVTFVDIDLRSVTFVSTLTFVSKCANAFSQDGSVPPYHSRRMARVLAEAGGNVTFTELRGKGHWWWASDQESDGGAMNDPALRRFYEQNLQSRNSLPPSNAALVTFNPAVRLSHFFLHMSKVLVNLSTRFI